MKKLEKAGLYWRTLRHLKAIQITNRIKRKLFPVKINNSSAPSLRGLSADGFYAIPRPKSILGTNTFLFLNKKEKLAFPNGWNEQSLSKLWLYNLHYFEGLMNEQTTIILKKQLIEQWISENPAGHGNGWEPYPISLRITNWIKWALSGNSLSQNALHSLAVQTRYLMKTIEFHLLGNHLFANAKALVFAGIFFEGPEAEKWLSKGLEILKQQIPEQFLADGSHYELSPTYHALLTEDLLDIIQIMHLARIKAPALWDKKALKAVIWLKVMTRPDGVTPLFNDAAYTISPLLTHILTLSQAAAIQITPNNLQKGMTDLPDSGYFRFEGDQFSLFGDMGQIGPDYIPGHAHCDMLNFELFAHGKPIIVDTGTSTYEKCNRRQIERSTASHNTIQINNDEQSEIWETFRVGKRARIIDRCVSNISAAAAHTGYDAKGVRHRRIFNFKLHHILISDTVEKKKKLQYHAIARIHFHPNLMIKIKDNNISAGPISLTIQGAKEISLSDYLYAPEFNKLLPAKVLEITFDNHLETQIFL